MKIFRPGRAPTLIFVALLPFGLTCKTSAIASDSAKGLPAQIKKDLQGTIEAKYSFTDKIGQHVLALTRDSSRLPDGTDNITLQASLYRFFENSWKQEWVIRDFLQCKDLDIEADFFIPLTSFSDLDSNGITETTVAYRLVCAGGIDTKPTKVIMRQGTKKFAVRGESLVRIEGALPFGGKFALEPNLDQSPAFKEYLTAVWNKAAGVNP